MLYGSFNCESGVTATFSAPTRTMRVQILRLMPTYINKKKGESIDILYD